MISKNLINIKGGFKHLYYVYPEELSSPHIQVTFLNLNILSIQIKWEDEFDLIVRYEQGLPTGDFWQQIPKNSIVIVDDLFDLCVNNEQLMKACQIWAKKHKFTLCLVTQVR